MYSNIWYGGRGYVTIVNHIELTHAGSYRAARAAKNKPLSHLTCSGPFEQEASSILGALASTLPQLYLPYYHS